jgi:hypothetical protein
MYCTSLVGTADGQWVAFSLAKDTAKKDTDEQDNAKKGTLRKDNDPEQETHVLGAQPGEDITLDYRGWSADRIDRVCVSGRSAERARFPHDACGSASRGDDAAPAHRRPRTYAIRRRAPQYLDAIAGKPATLRRHEEERGEGASEHEVPWHGRAAALARRRRPCAAAPHK